MPATKKSRDVEASYSVKDYVEKLRRFADALEKGERFQIQIAGERVYVPARAQFSIEHERGEGEEEIEFQIKWKSEA
jgi:amphi-Trp domain-containing protein